MKQNNLFFFEEFKRIKRFFSSLFTFKRKAKYPLKLHVCIVLLVILAYLASIAYNLEKTRSTIMKERETNEKQLTYWETIIKNHPDFPDAYYQAAWYEYTLGNKVYAVQFLNKALYLDPNFIQAENLKNKLE